MSQGELARQVGVKPQAFNAWMQSKSEPRNENLKKLAEILGCTEGELRHDIELSRNWVAPIAFDDFVAQALAAAAKEKWPNRKFCEKYLRLGRDEMWRDQDSVWATIAKDILSVSVPLQEKARRIAHVVYAWERDRNNPDPDLN